VADRLYLTPAIGSGTREDPRRPKYFDGLRYSGMFYGFQPWYLVGANLTTQQDADMVGHADVFGFPTNLLLTLSGTTAQQARDVYVIALIPEQWVNAGMSWLAVARTTAGMFQYMQRMYFYLPTTVLIDDATKLNIQFSSLPANIQQAMTDSAADLGYAITIQPNTQVRQILKDMADQWGSKPFVLNEFVF